MYVFVGSSAPWICEAGFGPCIVAAAYSLSVAVVVVLDVVVVVGGGSGGISVAGVVDGTGGVEMVTVVLEEDVHWIGNNNTKKQGRQHQAGTVMVTDVGGCLLRGGQ